MANKVNPCGAKPWERCIRARKYVSGAAIMPGDLVKTDSSGRVVIAAAGDALLGASISYASAAGIDVLVADHPDQVFSIQSSGAAPSAQTDIMLNYQIVATTSSTLYKISRMALDQSTGATNSNYQLKLLDIDSRPDDVLGANADCLVVINNHQLKGGTGTVGT